MHFNFSIRNLWQKESKLKSYFLFHKSLSKYKHIEIEFVSDTWNILSIEFKIGYKEDHAGIRFSFSLLGKEIYFQFYDVRHWDYAKNRWQENY